MLKKQSLFFETIPTNFLEAMKKTISPMSSKSRAYWFKEGRFHKSREAFCRFEFETLNMYDNKTVMRQNLEAVQFVRKDRVRWITSNYGNLVQHR